MKSKGIRKIPKCFVYVPFLTSRLNLLCHAKYNRLGSTPVFHECLSSASSSHSGRLIHTCYRDTMYIPKYHEQADVGAIHALMEAYPFGAWVCPGADGLIANHIPFLLD